QAAPFQGDVDIVDQRRFIRHHIVKILGALKSADNSLVRSLKNLDNSTLAGCSLAAPALSRNPITNNPRDHSIPVHRRTLVFSGNVQIAKPVAGFIDDVTKSLRIYLKRPDNQISLFRQNVTILPNAGQLPSSLKIVQESTKTAPFLYRDAESLRKVGFVQWLISWRPK